MRPPLFLLFLLGSALPFLPAQSNQLMDRMLQDEGADAGDAAYMLLLSAGTIEESESASSALSYAKEQGWLSEQTAPGDTITFGRFAYLLMEIHGEKGGVMYRLIPGPRYAAREAVFQGWTLQRRLPDEEISGEVALRVLGNYLADKGEQ